MIEYWNSLRGEKKLHFSLLIIGIIGIIGSQINMDMERKNRDNETAELLKKVNSATLFLYNGRQCDTIEIDKTILNRIKNFSEAYPNKSLLKDVKSEMFNYNGHSMYINLIVREAKSSPNSRGIVRTSIVENICLKKIVNNKNINIVSTSNDCGNYERWERYFARNSFSSILCN